MRVVVVTRPGVLELNWMWLPTWLGMNTQLKVDIERALRDDVVGKAITDETLDWVHDHVVALILTKFPGVTGLLEFFQSLRSVDVA